MNNNKYNTICKYKEECLLNKNCKNCDLKFHRVISDLVMRQIKMDAKQKREMAAAYINNIGKTTLDNK